MFDILRGSKKVFFNSVYSGNREIRVVAHRLVLISLEGIFLIAQLLITAGDEKKQPSLALVAACRDI